MAARRCSTCSINFPLHVVVCRRCGGQLWHAEALEVDEDWLEYQALEEDERAELLASALKPQRTDTMWREERFLALGFTIPQAERLAAARDADGVPLYHAAVATLLRAARATRDEDAAHDVVARMLA
jgi:hypothetical protein